MRDREQILVLELPRFLAAAGVVTYPLYLLHQMIGAALMATLLHARVPVLAALLSPRRAPPPDSLRSASLRAG